MSSISAANATMPSMFSGSHHLCYVTTDLDATIEMYAEKYGVRHFLRIPEPLATEVNTPRGREMARKYAAMAYVGEMMIELFEPAGGDCPIYAEVLPPGGGFALRFHHVAFRIQERAQWDAFRANLDTKVHPIAIEGATGELKFVYTDERARLGHYCEYMWLGEREIALSNTVPRN